MKKQTTSKLMLMTLLTLALPTQWLIAQAAPKKPKKDEVATTAPQVVPEKAKDVAQDAAKTEPAKPDDKGIPEKIQGINLGGNLVQGYTYNPQHPADGYNGITTWTDRANEYQLTQAWGYFEIPTDTSKKDFDFGGRVDLMFGSNYRWATSAGFEDKFKSNVGAGGNGNGLGATQYGLAIPAAYLDAAYKSVKLRVGHIISPVCYFTVDTTQNIFNTIPYTYAYGEPFTHFGAFLYWTVNDKLALMGGATRGGDNLDGAGVGSKKPGFLGTVTYTFDDKSTFDWVVHISSEYNYKNQANSTAITNPAQQDPNGNYPYAGNYNPSENLYSWRYFQTLVYKRELFKNLQWVFQSDFGYQKVADIKAALDPVNPVTNKETNAMWYGANTYFIYQALATLQLAFNFEWFRDAAGVRVGNVLPTLSAANTPVRGMGTGSNPYRGNYIGNFFQITFGPKWQPQKNFFVRLNGRYDYFDGAALNATSGTASGAPAMPFFDGNKRDQFIVGLDAAFLF